MYVHTIEEPVSKMSYTSLGIPVGATPTLGVSKHCARPQGNTWGEDPSPQSWSVSGKFVRVLISTVILDKQRHKVLSKTFLSLIISSVTMNFRGNCTKSFWK